jgi:hypothetical protein
LQSRHGIWYFQLWILARLRTRFGNKYLVRKSLRTRDRKLALRLARRLWVMMASDTDFERHVTQEADERERLYFKGKAFGGTFVLALLQRDIQKYHHLGRPPATELCVRLESTR